MMFNEDCDNGEDCSSEEDKIGAHYSQIRGSAMF
jgi:hypothetical protein